MSKRWIRLKYYLVGTILLGSIGIVRADVLDDWLSHKNPLGEPKITYTGKPITLKFSHPAPPASIVPPIWQQGFQWLEEATNGKLRIKEYGAGTLHGAKDGFKAVRSGISDYATCYTLFEPRGFEMSRVFALPFVTPQNTLVAARIYEELAEKYFVPEFKRRGVEYGYTAPLSPTDIMSKKPIRKLEDLKGLKIIAQGLSPDTAKALGFVTLNIPYPEIYTSFQQGIADAVLWVDGGFVPYKIYELARYHTKIGLYGGGIDTCINPGKFRSLPPDLQKAFYNFQQKAGALLVARGLDYSIKARTIYKKNKIQMLSLSPKELARWKKASQPVVEKWIRQQEAKGKPARALMRDLERLKKKYEGKSDEELMKLFIEKPIQGLIHY